MNPIPDPKTQPLFLTVGECVVSTNGGRLNECKQRLLGVETVQGSHVIAYAACARKDCPVLITASTPLELLQLEQGESAYYKIKAALEGE